eukprot:scaffold33831_cov111-Cyclotella_meneghiniana.AAC.4
MQKRKMNSKLEALKHSINTALTSVEGVIDGTSVFDSAEGTEEMFDDGAAEGSELTDGIKLGKDVG